ncbi:putative quinol monooxygenase [Natranaerofaba carboxydovora]|uniref:putative quinol monooxygenase n=1 Tax=Natranaerofaba carboxydovora TaxID=2742683 RepID=UPI001F13FA6A|nr:putative quinol monooxygenase [Natranaerofaba carboxydovora]UMZ74668.1 Antibiotic biosynthesis monooxygenase [Natranaerofaba carboxydovora]
MKAIVAKLKAKAGKEEELKNEVLKLTREVNDKEDDCLMYEPFVSEDDPTTIFIVEKYKNEEAIEYHRKTSHYISAKEKFEELLDGPPEVNVLDELFGDSKKGLFEM